MVNRRMLVAGVACTAFSPFPAIARQDALDTQALRRGRATVPVFLNDRGPFDFMADTAATASVISDDLVDALKLTSAGPIGMHTLVGREVVPTVRVARVRSGALDIPDVRLAVGRRTAMGGLDGLLGCDLLVDRTLILNFRGTQRVRIARSNAPARGFHSGVTPGIPLVVRGQRLSGNLLMIPAWVGRTYTVAIIDSGAEGTIVNRAAARAANATPLTPRDGQMIRWIQSPTGEVTWGQAMALPSLRVGDLTISNLAVAVGDFHSFKLWGLEDQPAILVGLDILRRFSMVHVDLKRSELSFRL